MVLSPSFTSLQGSLASSINDLTVEAEQLEKAIRHNDVRLVSKMVDLYLGKQGSEKVSQGSRRSSNHSTTKDGRPVLKAQLAFDEQNGVEQVVRRESGSTEDRECTLFTNALHMAIENNAYDVTILLLKSGIDPNEAGVVPFTSDYWRRSSHTSEDSNVHNQDRLLNTSTLNLHGLLSASREPLIRTPSIRTPMLLSPQTGASFLGSQHQQPHLYFSANSSPSSINSDLSSVCLHSSPTRLVRMRPEMNATERTVFTRADGTCVSYEDEYNRERLFTLPPIFLAVALNNSAIVRELIHFGANVNVADSHGVTPLHLCLCQEHITRACLQLLVQSGAKMRAKNKQSIAPYELVDPDLTEEMLYLQRFIIDDSFGQMLPARAKHKLNRKETMMYANYKSIDRHQLEANSNSSVNLTTTSAKQLVSKEESLDSTGSGPLNLARIFESKETPVVSSHAKRKVVQIESTTRSKASGKDSVHICLDGDSSDQGFVIVDSPASASASASKHTQQANSTQIPANSSLFLPSTISSLMGHKRSFAFESSTTNSKSTANSNVSTQ